MRAFLHNASLVLVLSCLACSTPLLDGIVKPPTDLSVASTITIAGVPAALAVGESRQLSVRVLDASSNVVPNASVTWSMSDARVATVSVTGLVAAVALGTATVVASTGSVRKEATVVVASAPPAPPVPPTSQGSTSFSAQQPALWVNTTLPAVTGRSITVRAGGDLQAALDQAQPGDEVVLEAGATYVGSFTLRAKAGASTVPGSGNVIIVRTSAVSNLAEGRRVAPSDARYMAKIVTTVNSSEAIGTAPAASGWRLVGIEITASPSVTILYRLLRFGDGSPTQNTSASVPSNLILDRSYVHGTPTLDVRRCVDLHSAYSAVIDSYLSECHAVAADAQAIAGWNGPGPYKINNNYLEGSGENIMFGGSSIFVPGQVPSDIEIRGNYFYKPLSWKEDDPSYAGTPWSIKNHFEIKAARRVLFADNVLENCWVAAQDGWAIIIKSDDINASTDITLHNNMMRGLANGVDIGGGATDLHRVTVSNNLLLDVGSAKWAPKLDGGRLFQVLHVDDVAISHNTAFGSVNILSLDGLPSPRLIFIDNIVTEGTYGVKGSGTASGIPTLDVFAPGYLFMGNGIIGVDSKAYPAGNFLVPTISGVAFLNPAADDYALSAASPFKGRASNGSDPGIDAAALASAIRRAKP